MVKQSKVQLGVFERYLAVWVVLCMLLGLFLSQYFPALSIAINNMQFSGISIPIGICLFLMMYPALLNLQLEELKKLFHNPKPIILTLISNWILAPLVTTFLAYFFLAGHDQLIVSLILLGSSPCTAMVLVWGGSRKRKPGTEHHQHQSKHDNNYVSVRPHCLALDGYSEHPN